MASVVRPLDTGQEVSDRTPRSKYSTPSRGNGIGPAFPRTAVSGGVRLPTSRCPALGGCSRALRPGRYCRDRDDGEAEDWDGNWRKGSALPISLLCLLAVSASGAIQCFSEGVVLRDLRAAAAATALLASAVTLHVRESAPALLLQGLFSLAVLLAALSCVFTSTSFLVPSQVAVLAVVARSGCGGAMFGIQTAIVGIGAVLVIGLGTSSDPLPVKTLNCGVIALLASGLVLLRVFSSTFSRSDSVKLSAGRSPFGKDKVQPVRRRRAFVGDPVLVLLEQLKDLTHGDRRMREVVNSLSEAVLAQQTSREPTLNIRKQSVTAGPHTVDDDTVAWLEQMVVPWQKLNRKGETAVPTSNQLTEVIAADIDNEVTAVGDTSDSGTTPVLPGLLTLSGTVVSNTASDKAGTVSTGRSRRRRSSLLLTESGHLLVAPDLPPEATALSKLLSSTTSPHFDVEDLVPLTNSQPLLCLVVYFSNSYFLVNSLELDTNVYQRFVVEVESSYRALPYHSSLHAADVLVNAVRLMKHSEIPVSLVPLEMLAIIVACAVHDVDHLGVNNAFLVSTNHDFAVQHNDQSVLESHHLYTAFSILRRDGCNFLKDVSYAQAQEFRHMVIEMVMATDFGFHLKIIGQFNAFVGTLSDNPDITAATDRLLMWRTVIKAADLGHVSKPPELHKKWSLRAMEEMYRQGDMESRMGFVISAATDRTKLSSAAKSQAGFLEFVCLPLFAAWHGFSQDHALLARVEDNIRMWKDMHTAGIAITDEELQDAIPSPSSFPSSNSTHPKSSRSGGSIRGSLAHRVSSILSEELLDNVVKAKSRPDKGVMGHMSIGTVTALKMAAKGLARSTRSKVEAKQNKVEGMPPRAPTVRLESCHSDTESAESAPASTASSSVSEAARVTEAGAGPTTAQNSDTPQPPWLRAVAKAGSRDGIADLSTSTRMFVATGSKINLTS